MTSRTTLNLFICLPLLLSACAGGQHVQRDQEAAWKNSVEQRLDSLSTAKPAPENPDELERLQAKISVLEAKDKRDAADAQEQLTGLETQITALKQEIKNLQASLQRLKSKQEAKAQEPPVEKAAEAPRIESAPEPAPAAQAVVAKPVDQRQEERAKRAYYDAYFALKNGDYFEASLAFRNFLRDFPDSKLAGEARYWHAEALLAQGDRDKALLAFQEILNEQSTTPRHAAAMLKCGLIYEEQRSWDEAVLLYNDLLRQYPASSEAESARLRLKQHRS